MGMGGFNELMMSKDEIISINDDYIKDGHCRDMFIELLSLINDNDKYTLREIMSKIYESIYVPTQFDKTEIDNKKYRLYKTINYCHHTKLFKIFTLNYFLNEMNENSKYGCKYDIKTLRHLIVFEGLTIQNHFHLHIANHHDDYYGVTFTDDVVEKMVKTITRVD